MLGKLAGLACLGKRRDFLADSIMTRDEKQMENQETSVAALQERISYLEEQIHRLQKLTALGELVGTTTHEFNNVLTTIINYAKMGVRHRDQATRDKAFEKIYASGQRAARITTSILGFVRNRSAGQEPIDLTKLIDDSLVLVERELAKYRIKIELQIEPAPPAMVNANQIQQVLLNLLINARQAMPQGGQLTVRLSHDPVARFVDISVRDTGMGIPPDKLPRIFERYYSTKTGPDASGQGGTGLGLAFCRDVIEAHRGRIRVESSPGRGTMFVVRLPMVESPATQKPAPAPIAWPSSLAPSEAFTPSATQPLE